jgi:hypothetical protein
MKALAMTAIMALLVTIPLLANKRREAAPANVEKAGSPAPEEMRYDIFDFIS